MVFLKSIKRNLLIISIMYVLVGYLLISGQGTNNELVAMVLAVGLGLSGIFSMIGYLLMSVKERYKRNEFIDGALLLIMAIYLYTENIYLIDFKEIISLAIGMSGIIKIQDLFDAKAIGKKVSGTYFGLAVICFVLCIFIGQNILIPEFLIYYVSGIGMIFAGISDLGSNIYLAACNSAYEAKMREEEESEKIIEEAEVNINSDESKPVSFIEKVLYEPEDNNSINIELTEKEKSIEPLKEKTDD